MESRYLYGSVTATGQLYFDAPRNLTVKGIFLAAVCITNGISDFIELEVSQASTNQTAVTDALNILGMATFCCVGAGTPASTSPGNLNLYCPCDAPVKAGERIYLNYTESGTATWRIRCLVWFT